MGDDGRISPSFVTLNQYATYNHALSSSVSTTNTSLWSDTASQSSDDTSVSNDSDACESYCAQKRAATACDSVANYRHALQQRPADAPVPVELRQNPRRTSAGNRARTACPPALVRQCDRKVNFVDSLVDSSTQIVETIWPLSSVVCRSELGSKAVLPLRTFIQETLRRSRTSYSTLQVALYYLILIKPHVPKHNFTTEQPDDRHADRALQCGRRMFLAALILASKYLQDRNYSARAWSKISGLNTQEINQNEISFLLAVNWKLHIADDVFQRWTEIVLKYTPPPSPPSPGGIPQTITQQSLDWKNLILKLNPELNNIEGLIPTAISAAAKRSDLSVLSPRSILNPPVDSRNGFEFADAKTVSLKSLVSPVNLEPMVPSGRMAPTMGMLPTPRLTPQTNGLGTPAVSAASQMLCKTGAMGFAMAQANCFNNAQLLERIPTSVGSSPQSYCPARRSSLANSVSAASSPESMISDTSRTSRSSSISSISSLASATTYNKLPGPSRFRAAKIWNERFSMKPTVPSVPEDHDELVFSASPESYNGSVSKLGDLSLDTPLARRELELEGMTRDPISDAARALQDLHNQDLHSAGSTPTTSRKRTRSSLTEGPLQDNVREILSLGYEYSQPGWSQGLTESRKRLRCSTEVANGFQPSTIHPAISHQGNGIWEGILN